MIPANLRQKETDILILGSGGAGLFAALHAHQQAPELKITVAVKGLLGKCGCTRMVQGGYNVALNENEGRAPRILHELWRQAGAGIDFVACERFIGREDRRLRIAAEGAHQL